MKRSLLAVALMMALTSCTTNSSKTLVAYFSATGTTKAVAETIAEKTSADLFEIVPENLYTAADLDWTDAASRSSVEMRDPSSRPAIVSDDLDVSGYDKIFLGFPIWWYTAPTIINTFIESHNLGGKTVVLFATSGSSNADKAAADLSARYPSITFVNAGTLNKPSKDDIEAAVSKR